MRSSGASQAGLGASQAGLCASLRQCERSFGCGPLCPQGRGIDAAAAIGQPPPERHKGPPPVHAEGPSRGRASASPCLCDPRVGSGGAADRSRRALPSFSYNSLRASQMRNLSRPVPQIDSSFPAIEAFRVWCPDANAACHPPTRRSRAVALLQLLQSMLWTGGLRLATEVRGDQAPRSAHAGFE